MYKFERYRQLGLEDFDQPAGLKMDPENRWVRKAATISWEAIEEKYAELFPSDIGMPAKPLRTALGSLSRQAGKQRNDHSGCNLRPAEHKLPAGHQSPE